MVEQFNSSENQVQEVQELEDEQEGDLFDWLLGFWWAKVLLGLFLGGFGAWLAYYLGSRGGRVWWVVGVVWNLLGPWGIIGVFGVLGLMFIIWGLAQLKTGKE